MSRTVDALVLSTEGKIPQVRKSVNTDYSLSPADAEELMGASLLPGEFRKKILMNYGQKHGMQELVRLFTAFIGLSNSVVANTREQFELYLINECNHNPILAEKINLPDIPGALEGVSIAQAGNEKMCGSCAFRLGTPANQCHPTTIDAKQSAQDCELFACHESLNEKGEPTRPCAGWAKTQQEK